MNRKVLERRRHYQRNLFFCVGSLLEEGLILKFFFFRFQEKTNRKAFMLIFVYIITLRWVRKVEEKKVGRVRELDVYSGVRVK